MRPTTAAFAIAAAWLALGGLGVLEPLERLSLQARHLARPPRGVQAPVTVVAIDERSLQVHGQMPWDRRRFAALLDRLAGAGATVVGLDLAFSEPARDPAEDRALAAALRRVPTVLPTFVAHTDAARTAVRLVEPLPELGRAAVALGVVQLAAKPQAVIWELEPYQEALGRRVPTFPVAVAAAWAGPAWSPPVHGFPWQAEPHWIDFAGPGGSAPQVSAADVLAGRLPPGALAGRVVLVGATAAGLPDTNFAVPDPRGGPMAGVEIAAHVIDDMLGGGGLRRLHALAGALLLILLALLVGRPLAAAHTGPGRRAAWLACGALGWVGLATLALHAGIWLELTTPLGLLAGCFLAGLLAERAALLTSRNALLARYAADLASESQRQRARLEGELHDGVQQMLVVMGRELRQVLRHAGPGETRRRLDMVRELVEASKAEVQRLRADLLPPALRHGDLPEALRGALREAGTRAGFAHRLENGSWEALPPEHTVELYWLVKEALNNVEKHAGAREVVVRMQRTGGVARVEIVDDGRGFVPPDPSVAPAGVEHSGLHRMWLRLQGFGGELRLDSAPGRGARVELSLPARSGRPVA